MRSSSDRYKKWLLHIQNNWPNRKASQDPLVCAWIEDKDLCAFDWKMQSISISSPLQNTQYADNYIDHLQSTNLLAVLGESSAWCLLDEKGVVLAMQTSPELKSPLSELGIEAGFCFDKSLIGTTAFSLAQSTNQAAITGHCETYKKALHDMALVCVPVRNDSRGFFLMAMFEKNNETQIVGAKNHLEALTHYPLKTLNNVTLFEDILDGMSEMVFVFDDDNKLKYANQAARKNSRNGRIYVNGIDAFSVSALLGEGESETLSYKADEVRVSAYVRRQYSDDKCICSVRLSSQNIHDENWRQHVLAQCVTKESYLDRFLTLRGKSGLRLFITTEVGAGEHYIIDYIDQQLDTKKLVTVDCLAGFASNEVSAHTRTQFMKLLESANGQILCFENIDLLSPDLQATLLKVLTTGLINDDNGHYQSFSVDLICCSVAGYDWETSRLNRLLYMRLSIAELTLRPLSQDRLRLRSALDKTLEQLSLREGMAIHCDQEALDALMGYHWPGNFLELFQTLESAIHSREHGTITLQALPDRMKKKPQNAAFVNIADAERNVILTAWRDNNGRAACVARALGVSRTTLWRKMKKFDLSRQVLTDKY